MSATHSPLADAGGLLRTEATWAAPDGTALSIGTVPITVTPHQLTLGSSPPVPLQWIAAIDPVGPGLSITWRGPRQPEPESILLCFQRGSGYDRHLRGQFVRACWSLVLESKRSWRADPQHDTFIPTCEVCSSPGAAYYRFTRVASFILRVSQESDTCFLCHEHASKKLRTTLRSILLLAPFGIPGLVISPVEVFRQASDGERMGLLPPRTLPGYFLAAVVPLAIVVAVVGFELWRAVA